jgi:hypothetical protein
VLLDKQLDWYERAARAPHGLAEKIDIAGTFQDEPKTPQKVLQGVWSDVQRAHLELDRAAQDAALYASDLALEQLSRINKVVQKVANETEAFDPPRIDKVNQEKCMSAIYALPEKLEKARGPLLVEARRHLGLKN